MSMTRIDIDQTREPDGSVTSVEVVRWVRDAWEPLHIRDLFTTTEWALAKQVATHTWESLALTFHAIPSETVIEHLRALVPDVLTESRFTEITGRAF